MPQKPKPVELTLKNGKKVQFTQFGKINFDNGIKTVDSLTEQEKKKIEKMYNDIAKKVQKEIDTLNLKGKETATDALRKMQLNDLKQSINKNLFEITQATQTMIVNNMTQSAQATTKGMTQWLNSFGINIKESYAYVPQDVVANIVSGRLYGKDWNFSKRIWGDYNKSVSDITQIVANGIAENKSSFDIAKDLEKYVDPKAAKPWNWGKVYPGSKKKVDYNAQRLARTMVGHAYQQSVVEMSKTNPFVKGIEWKAAFTHTTCEICEALNGQIFPVNEIPLDHPNGKCTFIAVIDKSPKEIAEAMLEWYYGNADDEFNVKMDLFAEKAGFKKSDFDLKKLGKIVGGAKLIQNVDNKILNDKYSEIDKLQNFEDIQNYISDNNMFLKLYDAKTGEVRSDYNKIIGLENADIKNLKNTLKAIEKLFDKYPFLRGHTRGFQVEEAGYDNFGSTSFAGFNSVINLNANFYNNYNNLHDSLLSNIKNKFHPNVPVKDTDSTFIHEFGHNIEAQYKKITEVKGQPSINVRNKIMKNYGGNNYDVIMQNVSEYATKNSNEWWAECFSEYICSENPRPVAKEFGEYLDKKIMPTIEKYCNDYDRFIEQKLKEIEVKKK